MRWKFRPCACTGGWHVAIDRSVPVAAETRREQEGQQHATIEDGTTRRVGAAKKNRRLIEEVGGEDENKMQEGAEVPPRRHILGGSVTLNIGKSGLVCSR